MENIEAIKSELFTTLRKELVQPKGKSHKNFLQDFIQKVLTEAKSNPNAPIGQLVAKQLFQEDIISELDAQADKYLARDIDFLEYRIQKTLYDKQRDVFLDFDKNKICICSRRVGKTELAARLLLKQAIHPDSKCLFVSLKFENAIRQCFPIVMQLVNDLNIPLERSSKSDGEILLANGSSILFKGNNNKAEADKLLGYKYHIVVIDEVQNQINLSYLIDTVLKPALKDYDGDLVLLGTPPRIPHTVAEKIWTEYKGWKKYSWDMSLNPFMTGVEEYIKDLCNEKKITKDAPFIQREYFGNWVYDKEARVLKDCQTYTGGIDYIKDLIKNKKFSCDIVYGGADFGFQDYNAIAMIAWDTTRKIGYILPTYKFNKSTVSTIAEYHKKAIDEAKQLLILSNKDPTNVTIYGDTSDKSIIFEMQTQYNLNEQCCYKHDKFAALANLSDLCRTRLYMDKDSSLYDESEQWVYKRDDVTDAILPKLDDDLFHADVGMATLYASRQLMFDEEGIFSK